MGLCYDSGKWLDSLWSEHVKGSFSAQAAIAAGAQKQGAEFGGFAADLHARLYLPSEPPAKDAGPEWAKALHEQASQLGEWPRLRSMCENDGFAAGVATESLLGSILPLVPQGDEPGEGQGSGEGDEGQGAGQGSDVPALAKPDEQVRKAMRRAMRAAKGAVEEAEAEMEGLETSCFGGSLPGRGVGKGGPADVKAIRAAHDRIKNSVRLRKIAEMAGRLERLAAAKAQTKVKAGCGEVHGIDQGGEIARLLPSEQAAIGSGDEDLELLALARIVENRALVYGMTSRETETRGPIVVLIDESGSMRAQGKDLWSKAVALALLSFATRQKRSWTLIAFDDDIRREVTIEAGRATPDKVAEALDAGCAGGTDFDKPVKRAIEIIKTAKSMRKADVLFVTDGIAELAPATIAEANKLTKEQGVSWLAVLVGYDARSYVEAVRPIATSIAAVGRLEDGDDPIADLMAGTDR